MSSRFRLPAIVIVVLVSMPIAVSHLQARNGQPDERDADSYLSTLTVDALLRRRMQIQEAAGIGEEAKAKAIGLYDLAVQNVRSLEEWALAAADYDAARENSPAMLADLQERIARLGDSEAYMVDPRWTFQDLEQLLETTAGELVDAEHQAAALELEPQRRAARRAEVPKLAARAQEQLEQVDASLRAPPDPNESPNVSSARRAVLLSRKAALEAELHAYAKEIVSYDARRNLLAARRDYASRRVSLLRERAGVLSKAVSAARREEAEQDGVRAQQARRKAAASHPSLHAVAEGNARLVEERTGKGGVGARLEAIEKELEHSEALLAGVSSGFQMLKSRMEAVGMTDAVGLAMRRQLGDLPEVGQFLKRIRERRERISSVQLRMMELETEQLELRDLTAYARNLLDALPVAEQEDQRKQHETLALELAQARRGYLEALADAYSTLFVKLVDLDEVEQKLVSQIRVSRDYINENVLWIRSAPMLKPADFRHAGLALLWLVEPKSWGAAVQGVFRDLSANPLLYALALLLFGGLCLRRSYFKKRLEVLGEGLAFKTLAQNLANTIKALMYTGLLAATFPLLPVFLSWRLGAAVSSSAFARTLGDGLLQVSMLLLALESLRSLCVNGGLGDRHFRWPKDLLDLYRRRVKTGGLVLLPLSAVVLVLEAQSYQSHKDSLGRLAFMAAVLLLFFWLRSCIGPLVKNTASGAQPHPGGLVHRGFQVLQAVAFLFPIALAALAFAGYYYSALKLTRPFLGTLWFAFCLTVIHALVHRWFLIARRALVLRRSKLRKEAEAQGQSETVGADGGLLVPAGDAPPDMTTISLQTTSLLHSVMFVGLLVGLWLIWANVLPAVGILDRLELWGKTEKVTEVVTGTDGLSSLQWAEKRVPVTAKDAMLALLLAVVTAMAGLNIPGFLEITVLQGLELESGVRHAVTTLTRYAITVTGVILAFGAIGVGWPQVQWLVAAMTVGLGFGLQEIFANFVSGLIILFERPIRLGDTVTVGDVSGTVSRIRIRATTITDWDRKELVVPNKSFITGQLINWSLSDAILRIVLNVGIAYGSDVKLAHALLEKVAQEDPDVLAEPPPKVVFEKFGESSLEFTLRVFIPRVSLLFKVRDALNCAIDEEFKKAGIEIAFPQRDIHIRSIKAPFEILPTGARPQESED